MSDIGRLRDVAYIRKLNERIAELENDKALLIKDLRETWDYEDVHIDEVLSGYLGEGE